MTLFVFSNNNNAALASPISAGTTTLTLTSGTGALYPAPTASQAFPLTLNDVATSIVYEICYCTARAGDVCTVLRGQEGTTARSWLAGDRTFCGPTAGTMAAFLQQGGSVYNVDMGAVNAIAIALTPAITMYGKGQPIVFMASYTNTLAPTVNAGGGPVSLFRSDGAALVSGDIQAGTIYQAISISDGGPFWLETLVPSQVHIMAGAPWWIYVSAPGLLNPGGYTPDTRAASFTSTLEPTRVEGDTYAFNDQFNSFGTNPYFIDPNGATIMGVAGIWKCSLPGANFTLVNDNGNYVVNFYV